MPDTNHDSDQIILALPSNLMAQIDAQVGSEFADRNDFLLAATRYYLDFIQRKSGTNIQSS